MNLTAAFFSAGIWMIASAIWQLTYRNGRVSPGTGVARYLGADVVPAIIVAFLVARFA